MTLRLLFVLPLLMLAAACSNTDKASAVVTAQKAAYTAKASYVALVTAADVYAKLPRCTSPVHASGVAPACSDQNVLDQMIKAQIAASAAINAFETASRNIASTPDITSAAEVAANDALAAFTTIFSTYSIPHK